ncbi:MAG TPA: hypothetical protein VF116_13090 [Ktedonobacterales bacterium]
MGKSLPQHQLDTGAGTSGVAARPMHRAIYIARKVPEITALFWVVKLLSTALGESTSDYLIFNFPGLPQREGEYAAVIVCGVGLVVALALQFLVRRYIAWVYWFAVVMVAVFGTMAADVMHVVLRVPYLDSTILFSSCLVVVFVAWYLVERTLSIHSIDTPRRELFYWATVMATFALGTAAGDMTASTLRLGYFGSALLFTGLFILPGLAYWLLGLNSIAAFWIAYVITRPLGASFADWFGKPQEITGLGFGDGKVALVLTVAIVIAVAYLAFTRVDVKDDAAHPHR